MKSLAAKPLSKPPGQGTPFRKGVNPPRYFPPYDVKDHGFPCLALLKGFWKGFGDQMVHPNLRLLHLAMCDPLFELPPVSHFPLQQKRLTLSVLKGSKHPRQTQNPVGPKSLLTRLLNHKERCFNIVQLHFKWGLSQIFRHNGHAPARTFFSRAVEVLLSISFDRHL